MSKIQKELSEATGVTLKRGAKREAFIDEILVATQNLDDAGWEALSKPAQDWFNEACDQKNANIKNPRKAVPVPDFPDLATTEEAKAPSTRRRAAEEPEPEPESNEPQVGDTVKVTTKRGKVSEGEVVEISDTDIVLKIDGEELEFTLAGATVEVLGGETQDDDGPAEPKEPEVGDEVTLVNSRDKEYTGEVIEISDDDIVLKVGKEELEFSRAKIKSLVVNGSDPEPEPEKTTTRRRGAADTKKDEPAGEKPKRSSNPKGVSIGGRIRELMADNLAITIAEVTKAMKGEGLEFRDTSVEMIYKDTKAFIELLKAAKKLK